MCRGSSIIFGPTRLAVGGARQRLSLQRFGVVALATIGACLAERQRQPVVGFEEPAACSSEASTEASDGDAMQQVKALPEAWRHMWDAQVALLFFLRRGTFLKASRTQSGQTLEGEPLVELCRWTSFVARALPTVKAHNDVRRLADVACGPQGARTSLDKASWDRALEGVGIGEVPAEAGKSPTCYLVECETVTCGLWMLFHYLTLAGDLAPRSSSPLLPAGRPSSGSEDTLPRLRGWVFYFFGCTECVTHFTGMVDSGAYGCKDLEPGDGAGEALWLWEVHNVVAHRVAGEQNLPTPPEWPEAKDCPGCRLAGGEWDRQAVLAHLRHAYVPTEHGDGLTARPRRTALAHRRIFEREDVAMTSFFPQKRGP